MNMLWVGSYSKIALRTLAYLLAMRQEETEREIYLAYSIEHVAAALHVTRQAASKAIGELNADKLLSSTYSHFRPRPRAQATG